MVGLVGYAPTTFRMSSEHSTIELKASKYTSNYFNDLLKILKFLFEAYNIARFIPKIVIE